MTDTQPGKAPLRRSVREGLLTTEEAEKYDTVREQVSKEYQPTPRITQEKLIAAYEEHINAHGLLEDLCREWMNVVAEMDTKDIEKYAAVIQHTCARLADLLNREAP